MNILKKIQEIAEAPPSEILRQPNLQGKAVVGHLCSFVPPELIHAAGAIPFRVRATGSESTEKGEAYFAQTHCSFVRHVMGLAVKGAYSYLDGVVFVTGCDHGRRLYDNWKFSGAGPLFLEILFIPANNTAAAVDMMRNELKKLRDRLSSHFKVEIDDEALRQAIKLFNRQRTLLAKVHEARKQKSCPLTGKAMLHLYQALTTLPVEMGTSLLEEVLQEVNEHVGSDDDSVRLFLASSHFEDPHRMEILESVGGKVVHDLMCTGVGHFDGLVDEDEDPLTALARRNQARLSCPHAIENIEQRMEFIKRSMREWSCDGIIVDRLTFCSIWSAEAFVYRRHFQEAGIPVLFVESELYGGGDGQVRTRVEAFVETLTNRRGQE